MTSRIPLDHEAELEVEKDRRREFLNTMSKLAGLTYLFGVTGMSLEAVANPQKNRELSPQTMARARLLFQAIQTGDTTGSIKTFGEEAKLTPKQLEGINSLTKEELRLLKNIFSKLGPIDANSVGWCM